MLNVLEKGLDLVMGGFIRLIVTVIFIPCVLHWAAGLLASLIVDFVLEKALGPFERFCEELIA